RPGAVDDADHRARVRVERVVAHDLDPTVRSSSVRAPARTTTSLTVLPARGASAWRRSSGPSIATPSSSTIRSPTSTPADAAGPPSSRLATSAPPCAGYAPTP